MTSDLLLGVDVGTTQTKVGAFDLQGQLVAVGRASYSLNIDPDTNAAEQDPNDWWSATAQAIQSLLSEVEVNRITAICVGGQGPTVVAVDANLEPVFPALTWMDLRAIQEAKTLNERTGGNLPPHFFMPKAMWLKANRPEAYAATHGFCQSWDFVASQLVGKLVVSTSPGIAPWKEELISAAELDHQKFPDKLQMGEQIGQVSRQASQSCGLPEGLPVVGGISDFFGGLIGSGALSRGLACDNGGASTGFSVNWDNPLESKSLLNVPSFIDGKWYVGGAASTTGKALDWWLTSILGKEPGDYSSVDAVSAINPGSEKLIFLPYLAGERAPIWDPQARGVFFGLSLNHRHEHMTRAILESVAYTQCHLIEQISAAGGEVVEIRSCGGQAKNEIWCGIKADATGIPVAIPEITDAPMLGTAIIAGVGVDKFDDFSQGAENMVRKRTLVEPDQKRHAKYKELYSIYRELYDHVKPLYQTLNKIN
ncbi:MAG: hypothetical protein FVQ83_12620 [Chloroflexi bacterium]|nr:hypothetical protein [Chloroflexota bacterium]